MDSDGLSGAAEQFMVPSKVDVRAADSDVHGLVDLLGNAVFALIAVLVLGFHPLPAGREVRVKVLLANRVFVGVSGH